MNETGNLIDAQENVLEENCTLSEAREWLRQFHNGRGWQGGRTAWIPYGDSAHVEFG